MSKPVNWPAMLFVLVAAMGAAWAAREWIAGQERELLEAEEIRRVEMEKRTEDHRRLEDLRGRFR
jgi:hypothetical protein